MNYFKIVKINTIISNNYPINFGDINILKINNSIKIFYKNKPINDTTIYIGENKIIGTNLFNTDRDIILIGGPVVNKYVRDLIKKGLIINISNTYPGKNKGVIIKIKNPYSSGNIYILAGSDRWGTKKAIDTFIKNSSILDNKKMIFVN